MRSFQNKLADFTSRGIHVAAISVDSVEINRGYSQKMGFNFPLLSDADAGVIRRYDVLHRGAGPKNNDVASPAEFYVDANGTVQWVNLTETIAVRATGTSIERHRCDEGWPAIDAASLT